MKVSENICLDMFNSRWAYFLYKSRSHLQTMIISNAITSKLVNVSSIEAVICEICTFKAGIIRYWCAISEMFCTLIFGCWVAWFSLVQKPRCKNIVITYGINAKWKQMLFVVNTRKNLRIRSQLPEMCNN